MTNSLSVKKLQLTLDSSSILPSHLCWRLSDGYIRANTWTADGDVVTIGLAGPGDLIAPLHQKGGASEMACLTRVSVEEVCPSNEELAACLNNQMEQAITLLQIGRLRPVDARLIHLLHWIGARFGIISSQGTVLSLQDMNLTHRILADLTGMTRVSVTKALSRFKASGLIVAKRDVDLLLPNPIHGQPWTV
ncbi:Crp/Fnr family transcriptional regulator [Synechococcus sp. CS-1324]|uniref:Crp/Fnr family transcriptional regulator n=1 Tax=Synechococcus sp. CS-1324 TaxID=2847980 RepID=UPI000DB4989D|nr:Crp/Fnr family transcriptional regulator [Synechococcus sp. CS-1324]MCT0230380.1 Crp/Fnr family transcriptional regulator [Synechococcus sp. CS-1324]PZV02009.1 MAG: hypothetical protein DCF23_12310 [Cyanobium sp.]